MAPLPMPLVMGTRFMGYRFNYIFLVTVVAYLAILLVTTWREICPFFWSNNYECDLLRL